VSTTEYTRTTITATVQNMIAPLLSERPLFTNKQKITYSSSKKRTMQQPALLCDNWNYGKSIEYDLQTVPSRCTDMLSCKQCRRRRWMSIIGCSISAVIIAGCRDSVWHRKQQSLSNVLIILQSPAFGEAVQRSTELTNWLGRQTQPETVGVLNLNTYKKHRYIHRNRQT